jgi:O-antigen ligase
MIEFLRRQLKAMTTFVQTESLKDNTITDRIIFYCLCGLFFFIALGATSPAVITSIAAISIWLFSGKFLKQKDEWLKQKWTMPVLFFMLLPWLGLLWTNDVKLGLDFADKSYYWILSFIIASVVVKSDSRRLFFDSFLIGLFLFCIASILQFINIIFIPEWIPTIFSKSITHSLLLVFGILVLSYYFKVAENNREKILLGFLMALFFFTISIGIGRSGYLAFILLSPIIAYNLAGKRFYLILAVVALSMLFLFSSPAVQSRIASAVNDIKAYQAGNPNTSIGLRLNKWQGAVRIFFENPLAGAGTGGYAKAMIKYDHPNLLSHFRMPSEPHNSFLFMAASYGILGIISIVWLFAVYFKKGLFSRNSLAGFAVLSYGLVLLIGSLTATQIISLATAKMFAILIGIRTKNGSL